MESYGVCPVNQDFTSTNDRVDINSVQGSLVGPEDFMAKDRDWSYMEYTATQRADNLEPLATGEGCC